MKRISVFTSMLAVAAACTVPHWTAMAQSASTGPKHYRLTFILSYPQGKQPSQTLVLDVPVSHDHAGQAGSAITSGLLDAPDSMVVQKLLCTEVHESPTGLSAQVSFTLDSTAPPVAGIHEPIHNKLTFERKVDLRLGEPTRITSEMHATSLKKGDPLPPAVAPAPQISVTAAEI